MSEAKNRGCWVCTEYFPGGHVIAGTSASCWIDRFEPDPVVKGPKFLEMSRETA